MQQLPKIGILSNSSLGIPSIHALLSNKLVAAVGVPNLIHNDTTDIKAIASQFNVNADVFSKDNLTSELSQWITKKQLDVVLVFTFPWKVSIDVLNMPKYGFLNFHFGLLPNYRGADAVFWTIKNREPFGGISVHKMDAGFDTGGLLHVEKVPLLVTDTYGMHCAKLSNANLNVLQKVLPNIIAGNIVSKPQDEAQSNYYKRQTIKDISIDWNKQSAEDIVALVNACNPWNRGAYTSLNNMPLRITEAEILRSESASTQIGEIISIGIDGIAIQCVKNIILSAKIITIDEGVYTAERFAKNCGVSVGLKFA